MSNDINLEDIDYNSRYGVGYLSLSGTEKLFALDGQHRLAGIRSALKEKAEIGDDEVSVIIVAHHTNPAGQKRTRKLFTTLNKTAKPVSKSEIIALDEADAMAITARQLVEHDPRFNDKLVHIKSKQSNLPKSDRDHLITLINLYDILEILFAKSQRGTKSADLKRLRPSDADLEKFFDQAKSYFELLGKSAPELRRCMASANPDAVIKKNRHDDGGHVLFRPVGLLIFTEIVATLRRTSAMSLEDGVVALKLLPTDLAEPPYANILWDTQTGTMNVKNRALTRDLLLYYLGHIKESGRIKKLQARYALLLGDDAAKLPSRPAAAKKRIMRTPRG